MDGGWELGVAAIAAPIECKAKVTLSIDTIDIDVVR